MNTEENIYTTDSLRKHLTDCLQIVNEVEEAQTEQEVNILKAYFNFKIKMVSGIMKGLV